MEKREKDRLDDELLFELLLEENEEEQSDQKVMDDKGNELKKASSNEISIIGSGQNELILEEEEEEKSPNEIFNPQSGSSSKNRDEGGSSLFEILGHGKEIERDSSQHHHHNQDSLVLPSNPTFSLLRSLVLPHNLFSTFLSPEIASRNTFELDIETCGVLCGTIDELVFLYFLYLTKIYLVCCWS